MSEMEKKKKYPFEIDEYYSVGLNSLKRVYTQHPDFNGDVRLIYELLLDHWNADYGYAFPDQWQLAIESGQSLSSVKRRIKVLKDLDLIEVRKSPLGKRNNVYYLKKPVTTLDEFYKKFPEIEQKSKERIAKIRAERESDMKKWDEDKKIDAPYTRPKNKTAVIFPRKKEKEESHSEEIIELTEWL